MPILVGDHHKALKSKRFSGSPRRKQARESKVIVCGYGLSLVGQTEASKNLE